MDKQRIAAIDLGSNTFHLLVVERQDDPPYFNIMHRERHFVYVLGPDDSRFGEDAIQRARMTLEKFQKLVDEYKITQVKTVATAAFRASKNFDEFNEAILPVFHHEIKTISGIEEAQLAFKGVQLMQYNFDQNNLIVDIGGGSVEFIYFTQEGFNETCSVKMGISFLRHHFQYSDPVKPNEKALVFNFFEERLRTFWSLLPCQPSLLIGMSGPFEIIEAMQSDKPNITGNTYEREEILDMSVLITGKDKADRKRLKRMPENRHDLSKESFLIIEYLLLRFKSIEKILVSPFGIKEGIISETLNLV